MTIHVVKYCECDFCGEMTEVQRNRTICPFEGRKCQGNIFIIDRIECDECDYADDYHQDWQIFGCPQCN